MASRRLILAAGSAAASILLLSSCGLLGPNRDADGRVTETTVIGSTQLLEGDCFSFVEGSNLTEASVTPCANPHDYIVIGTGELDAAAVDSAGGVQNAVNEACAESFAAFKETVAEGVKPTAEFIVATEDRDGAEITLYRCLATDSE